MEATFFLLRLLEVSKRIEFPFEMLILPYANSPLCDNDRQFAFFAQSSTKKPFKSQNPAL